MDLFVFHRILIGTAIAFDIFFTVFCIRKYNITGDGWELLWAALSTIVMLGFVGYMVLFHFKTAKLQKLREQMKDAVPCPDCGYNLRGTDDPAIGKCPECGQPISETTRQRVATA